MTIVTALPRSARPAGWVPTTRPTGMLESTALPTTGWNPAEATAAMASPRASPVTLGIDTMSPNCTMPLGSANSRNGIPAEARSMICFQIGAAMVAPKTLP